MPPGQQEETANSSSLPMCCTELVRPAVGHPIHRQIVEDAQQVEDEVMEVAPECSLQTSVLLPLWWGRGQGKKQAWGVQGEESLQGRCWLCPPSFPFVSCLISPGYL